LAGQTAIILLGLSTLVIQTPASTLSRLLVHKIYLLKARMIITAYNPHVGSFFPSLGL
jgi:hypothetical protein